MTRIRDIKTTFTAGEVSQELLGRGDLRSYENGASALRNVFIKPTGGVTRRFGLSFIDQALGDARLIAFEFNTEQTALIVLTDARVTIYNNGVQEASIAALWSEDQIAQIAWTQSADTLLLVHPDLPPRSLERSGAGVWSLKAWTFYKDDGVIEQPYFKFADSAVTIQASATTGPVTLTASDDVFVPSHKGTRFRIAGKEVIITDFESAKVVSANLTEPLSNTDATIDWSEQAFSSVRGYPASVAFHQGRLVIGGSRDLPNRLWFSKSGDIFNFDLGEGLDDEAIEFAILSDQVNAIRGIFSGRHLQVFTSGGEWTVTGDPLTPTSAQVNRQTRIGSRNDRYIPPVNVDGATFYVARNRNEIHEFIYTDLEQAYSSTNIAVVSQHVIEDTIDQDYNQKNRLLFIVRGDGRFATMTVFRAEQVSAWTLHETDGEVKSVSVVGNDVYMLVLRNEKYYIEQFDENVYLDSSLSGEVSDAATTWSGLTHLEGKEVQIIADNILQPSQIVIDGQVTLKGAANAVQIGLPYTYVIEPLPPSLSGSAGGGRKVRLIEGTFRVQDTVAMRVDVGRGLKDVALRDLSDGSPLDKIQLPITGDIKIRAIGWQRRSVDPLWRIEQAHPLPFTLLSVASEIKVND